MTPNNLASLNNVYALLKSPKSNKQTTYTIWRGLTSQFDIVGFIIYSGLSVCVVCVYETIELFELYGLKTNVLVCDDGSANVAAIKTSHGVYSISEDQEDKFKVTSRMIKSYRPTQKIFWFICPSHQVTNLLYILNINSFFLDS